MDHLLPYCRSERQSEVLSAVIEHGGKQAAANALGISVRRVFEVIELVQRHAAKQGTAPEHDMTHTVPDGYKVKGVSTYYNSQGQPVGQWVKSAIDEERQAEIVRMWVDSLADTIKPLPAIESSKDHDSDLLSVYPMGDPHFGMYALAIEAGDDFSLDECDRLTRAAIDRLVSKSPKSEKALLLNLGDFFHADDSSNATPASKNPLDVDGRFAAIMERGLDALVYCVKRLLKKHKQVEVWCMPGNHDPHSAFAIAMCLRAYFGKNQRVTIDMSPSLYKYMRFGNVLIGAHHGHGAKGADLPLLMAADRRQDWGATEYRYWYCGHIHHKTAKESPGCIVETFRTLAPRDAWHAGKGYRAGRDMQLIVHHKDFGEVMRARCDVAMIK